MPCQMLRAQLYFGEAGYTRTLRRAATANDHVRGGSSAMPKKSWYPLAKKESISSSITRKSEGALLECPPFSDFPLTVAIAKQR